MKKAIKKYWGIALVVVMLSSLFVVATPAAAADPLMWNAQQGTPMALNGFYTAFPGTDINDFAVSADGMTAYAALNLNDPWFLGAPVLPCSKVLVKSTSGGAMWNDLTDVQIPPPFAGYINGGNDKLPATILNTDFVAIAPDDPDVVVVVDATSLTAAASTDGGLHFYDMGTIQDTAGNAAATIRGVDVSAMTSGGVHYVAIAGSSATDPAIFYYNLGATIGTWRNAVTDFNTVTPPGEDPPWNDPLIPTVTTIDEFFAVKFSPNFGGDFTAVAVSRDPAGTLHGDGAIEVDLHIISFSSKKWDSDLLNISSGVDYPVELDYWDAADAAVTSFTLMSADIALGPEFAGSEEETLYTFVGAAIDTDSDATNTERGIYRVDDSAEVDVLRKVGTNSIDYNGTTLAAGMYDNNNVYRSNDPLAASPSMSAARSMKRIGINDTNFGVAPADLFADRVVVNFAGETLYGAKRGDASGFSKSTDNGYTWNDYSLLDSSLTNIDDIYFAPDASTWYVAANDWNAAAVPPEGEASIYRISGFSMARVLCVDQIPSAGALDFMLRGTPSDINVIYAADKAGTTLYTTLDGGLTRWSNPPDTPYAIADLAVESGSVAYFGSGVNVYKSTSRGLNWDDGVNSGVLGGIFQLVSLGDGKLLCSGVMASVVFSKDGGATWTGTMGTFQMTGFVPVYVTATGLEATDYIFAAPVGVNDVYRCLIGPPGPPAEFKTMNFPGYGGTATTQGIVLNSGVLYVLGAENVASASYDIYLSHTLAPTIPGEHTLGLWGTQYTTDAVGTDMGYSTVPVIRATATGTTVTVYSIFNWLTLFGTYTPPSIMYFQDIVSLNAPQILGPADDVMIDIVSSTLADSATIVFSWKRANVKITSYDLWIAKDEAFTEIVNIANVPSINPPDTITAVYGRSILFPLFNPGETYYWKVMASTPFSGMFSETRSFTVAPSAASVPITASPANGATITNDKPSFSWSPVTGTTKYEFQMDTVTTFTAPMLSEQLATTAIMPNVTLEVGKTYFWRVRALEPIPSDWSAIANFTLAEPVVTPTPTITVAPTPTFTVTIPPQQTIIVPTPTTTEVSPAYIWAIIIIGAVLVIAVIVLIVRTRRSV